MCSYYLMFAFKLLGVFDILAGIILIMTLGDVPFRLLLGHALYLIIKGYIFRGNTLSAVDLGIGFYGLMATFFPIGIISFFAGMYLFAKGVLTVIS